jgi:hypothetical protein
MKRIMIIGCVFFIFIASCKNDKEADNQPVLPSVLDHMPLAIGNFWVYETYSCDSGGVNCVSMSKDTTKVTKDTLINGNIYFQLEGKNMFTVDPLFLRDSGDYLVDQTGTIYFTSTDSTQLFGEVVITGQQGDTLFYWYTKLIHPAGQVSVATGTYDCLDMRTSLYRKEDNFQIEHQTHQYYARDVGLVKQTSLFVSSLKQFKRELIGYYLVSR